MSWRGDEAELNTNFLSMKFQACVLIYLSMTKNIYSWFKYDQLQLVNNNRKKRGISEYQYLSYQAGDKFEENSPSVSRLFV